LGYHDDTQFKNDALAIGALSAFLDYGNQHSYPNQRPSENIQLHVNSLAPMNGTKPMVATETGYCTDRLAGCPSELATGKYYSRLFFEYLNAGVLRTYGYELLDDPSMATNDDALGGWQANFGMVHTDGTDKPSFTAVSREIALLGDPGPAFTPGALKFTVNNPPNQVHHTVLQKRNGTFYLVFWQEVDCYNHDLKIDIEVAPVSIDVSFVRTFTTVNQYDPLTSKQPISTASGVSKLTLSVPDQAIILELVP
jgi:hypothetical protein